MDRRGRRWWTARGGGDGFAGDWGRCCGSGANTSHRGSTFLTASNGTQVARDPIGLLDRLNGGKAPPPSTGVIWTAASAPIYSDAVSWTRRPASASQAGGRAQEGPEACATTPVVENQKISLPLYIFTKEVGGDAAGMKTMVVPGAGRVN